MCNIFGSIYVVLLVIDLLLNITKILAPNANLIFLLGSYFFILLSIRLVFLLEIKVAVIIGIITCVASGITYILLPEWLFSVGMNRDSWLILNSPILIFMMFVLNLLMLFLNLRTTAKEEAIVKRKIIEFGGNIARLKVKDISEKSNVDTSTVFRILFEMIRNQEIYAEYFKSSKTVAFNQIANLENFDTLMKLYDNWEHQKLKKI